MPAQPDVSRGGAPSPTGARRTGDTPDTPSPAAPPSTESLLGQADADGYING